jgi:murein L,D-transpeptidase YcbB/YkuD
MVVLVGSDAAAVAQVAPRQQLALSLDAGPAPEQPDPLTPQSRDEQPRRAPAPARLLPETEPTAADAAIVAAVRQRLADAQSAGERGSQGEREDKAALVAFFAAEKARPLWTEAAGLQPRAKEAIEELGRADDWGLTAAAFELPAAPPAEASPEALAEAESKLALAVLKYARHARGGRLDPAQVSRKFDQKPRLYDPGSLLEALARAEDVPGYLRGLHPKHAQFERLRQALIAARHAKGDEAEGAARSATSIERLIANMERWRWMPDDLGDFYVWDSVPEQMTRVVDAGKTVLEEKIVVGKPSSPTPIFSADMQFVIFHPSWGVPPGMKVNELWPQLRNTGGGWFSTLPLASTVLNAHGLRVSHGGVPVNPDSIDWSHVDIHSFDFTQPPGPSNVLGIVKFRFPNRHDIYMHDTPERNLFGGSVRAFSHGCMRVQNPVSLAEVLLAHDKGWSKDKVQEFVRHGGEIKLTTPIPVHVTYFTVAAEEQGKLLVFADVYGLDARVASALTGRSVHVATAEVTGKRVRSALVKARTRRLVAGTQSFNPLAALFGN